jgi:hypothetical protein
LKNAVFVVVVAVFAVADVSDKPIASIMRMELIIDLGTMLTVTRNEVFFIYFIVKTSIL